MACITEMQTKDERMVYLAHANAIRSLRVRDRQSFKADGVRQVVEIIENPPRHWRGAHVADLLRALPYFGRGRTASVLSECRVGSGKRVGGLTVRQRLALSARLLEPPR